MYDGSVTCIYVYNFTCSKTLQSNKNVLDSIFIIKLLTFLLHKNVSLSKSED